MVRILIVEDDRDCAESIAAFLEHRGYEVRTAHGIERARSILESESIDVMLIDLKLPDGCAEDLSDVRPRVSILVTGHSFEDAPPHCDAHLFKPVCPDALCSCIERLIGP